MQAHRENGSGPLRRAVASEFTATELRIAAAQAKDCIVRPSKIVPGISVSERRALLRDAAQNRLLRRFETPVVFSEHDMDIVFKIAPEIVVLCYGRILATGTPDSIRRNEAVIEAYLGTEHHAEAAI